VLLIEMRPGWSVRPAAGAWPAADNSAMASALVPTPWLVAHQALLPGRGEALDVACGRGRNALWLAERGLDVHAVDRDAEAIDAVRREANARHLPIVAGVCDLEAPGVSLGRARYDVIVVVHYLHRPLRPALIEALRPGGLLIYETFTRDQALRGKPMNPDFLLEKGELRRLVAPLTVLDYREGEFEGRDVASVVARGR
jgi:SAM-dependent methyltransferase